MELEEKLLIALQDSIKDAFSTTLSVEVELIEEGLAVQEENRIASTIGFTGTIEGNLTFCLSDKSACDVVSKMIGMDFEEVDNDVCDGVGELNNMVIGGVKMRITEINQNFEIGVPTIIKGSELEIHAEKGKLTRIQSSYQWEGFKIHALLDFKVYEADDGPVEVKSKSTTADEAFNRLSQLVGANAMGSTSSDTPAEAKPNPLDALKAAASKVAEPKEEVKEEAAKEVPANPLDALKAAASKVAEPKKEVEAEPAEEKVVEIQGDKKIEKQKDPATEGMSAIEKLDYAMKKFKEIKPVE